jgi:hypothetical protein
MFRRLLLIALLAIAPAAAQRGGGGSRRGGGDDMNDMGGMRTQQPVSRIDQFADKLKLNSEQKEEVNRLLSATRERAFPVTAEIEKSRAAIATAMIEGKGPDEIKQLMQAHTALEAQMDTIEAELFTKVLAMLKPNQQSKAGQAFELMAGLFDRAGSNGGRRAR